MSRKKCRFHAMSTMSSLARARVPRKSLRPRPRTHDGSLAMTRFDLVIFDCDGVVVDSERVVHEVFGAFIRSLGANLDAARMNELFLGRRLDDCIEIVERMTGRTVPHDALDRYRAERDRVLRERVRPVAGVREVIE